MKHLIIRCSVVAVSLVSLLQGTASAFGQATAQVVERAVARGPQQGQKTLVDIDPAAAQQISAGSQNLALRDVPLVSGENVNLELERFEVFSPDARIVEFDGISEKVVPAPDVILYKGRDTQDPSRSAFVSVTNQSEVRMMVWGEKGPATFISPERDATGVTRHALQPADPSALVGFVCGTEGMPKSGDPEAMAMRRAITSALTNTLLEAELLLDVDYRLFTLAFESNSGAVNTYVANLMGASSAIYQRDINVVLTVKNLVIWTQPDPFDGPSSDAQLTNYENYNRGNAARRNIQRDVAHLLAFREFGGIAYLGALCEPTGFGGFGYGVSNLDANAIFPVSGYHWDLHVVTHELGHNFNSPHSHCYSPPIDCCYAQECDCGIATPTAGTIMSYCHLLNGGSVNLVFHDRCKNVMRTYAENSGCLSAYNGGGGSTAEINVQGNGANIADGTASTNQSDGTFYGSTGIVGGTITRTFTIQNLGSATLFITGVSMTGPAAGDFSVVSQPAASVSSGSSTQFQIKFDPSQIGLRAAEVQVANNDSNENPYNFAIAGQGTGEAVITTDVSIAGSATPGAFPNTTFAYTFTATNNGPSSASNVQIVCDLPDGVTFVSASATVGAPVHAAGFVTVNCGTVAVAQSVTLTVNVSAGAPGVYTALATVSSSTADSNTGNNNASASTSVTTPSGPDLLGNWSSVTQTCRTTRRGTNCSLRGTFNEQNLGTVSAGSHKVEFYLSDNAVYNPGIDTFIRSVSSRSLRVGTSSRKALSYRLPAGTTATGKFVIAVVDGAGAVGETNEANNVFAYGPLP